MMTNSEIAQRWREKQRAANRCIVCGEALADDGRVTCPACRAYNSHRQHMRRAIRMQMKLCTRCGEPLPPGCQYLTCPACREKFRNYMKARKKKEGAP